MSARLPQTEFAVLFAVLLTVAAGNTALQTVIAPIARAIHIPDMLVALVFSLSALIWTFTAPYWARQSDIRGRRRLMQVGLIGFAVSMLGCGLAIFAGLKGLIGPIATFGFFVVLRSLFGLFGSASNPAAQAYVAARTSEAERTSALSTLASAFGLGTIIGPAVAPLFIMAPFLQSGPLFAFSAIAIAVLVALRRFLPDDDPAHAVPSEGSQGHGAAASEPSLTGGQTGASLRAATLGRGQRLSWRDSRIFPFMAFGFASGSIQAATGQALAFLIIDRLHLDAVAAQKEIAIVFIAGALATLLAQWGLIPKLQLRPSQLMRWGSALAALGTVGIAVASDFHGLVVAYALTSLGYGFARPGFTAGSSLAVGHDEQGGTAGAVTSINGACFVAAPAIGISLYELSHNLPYWMGAAGLIALVVYSSVNTKLRTDPALVHEPA
jgi:MFS family permease